MARIDEHKKALALRKSGMSYSQISNILKINKSTLSGWLKDLPLSKERVLELRAHNPVRIARYQETMRKKRTTRRDDVYESVCKDMQGGKMSKEIYAGFYLYWAEGTKSAPCTVALTNSDPSMIIFFIAWLTKLGVSRSDMKVKLHLYSDMDISASITFWSQKIGIPKTQFYKPYIKETTSISKIYKGMFAHGTCSVVYHNRDVYEYVLAVIKYLQEKSI